MRSVVNRPQNNKPLVDTINLIGLILGPRVVQSCVYCSLWNLKTMEVYDGTACLTNNESSGFIQEHA